MQLLLPEHSSAQGWLGAWQLDSINAVSAETLLAGLPGESVDAIITDPPYNGVKDDAWDNQWATDNDYLVWLDSILSQFKRVLKRNGSLYLFASPRMAARVEVLTGSHFNVLNRITWRKPPFSTKAEMFDKDTMRAFFPASEAIIFAEHFDSDSDAENGTGYYNLYEEAKRKLKVRIMAEYLANEFLSAGVSRREIASLFPSKTGGMTGCVSNWLLGYNIPTAEQYQQMRDYLNGKGGDYLRREYDDLRREYDDLRREYDDLRRPFFITNYRPYNDVWDFKTVQAYDGKHPCEKPLSLMRHIIETSSRKGAIVLDCFAGSGTTLKAAQELERRFIAGDISPEYCAIAERRLAQPFTPLFPAFA